MRILKYTLIAVLPIPFWVGTAIANCQIPQGLHDVDLSVHRSSDSICNNPKLNYAAQAAMQMVCVAPRISSPSSTTHTVVLGFVGGFANPRDEKHPEILFAQYLRERYGQTVQAAVFANHDEDGALQFVLTSLSAGRNGDPTNEETHNARIVLYGHSWGASEVAAFARKLERRGIPVELTIQVDIITKPGQSAFIIPPNVGRAINFYQREGVLRGKPMIKPSDPDRTKILGNFERTYRSAPVNCGNYPWFARTFNKPHHEIENDPTVWAEAASLIQAEMTASSPTPAIPRLAGN